PHLAGNVTGGTGEVGGHPAGQAEDELGTGQAEQELAQKSQGVRRGDVAPGLPGNGGIAGQLHQLFVKQIDMPLTEPVSGVGYLKRLYSGMTQELGDTDMGVPFPQQLQIAVEDTAVVERS